MIKFESIYTRFAMDHVLEVVINRPDCLNALSMKVLGELAEAFKYYGQDPDVRVIILTGQGEKAFIAGADIEEMSSMGPLEFREYAKILSHLTKTMDDCEKPIIGSVKGFAFGGGNIIAMHCDFVFATSDASFGQQEIDLGIMGGVSRLIYLVGLRRAFDIVLTGRVLSAKEAENIGLINMCLPKEEFENFVLNYAKKLVGKPAVASKLIKAAKNMTDKVCLEYAQQYEDELLSLCFSSHDAHEGLSAFVEKRGPRYTGK